MNNKKGCLAIFLKVQEYAILVFGLPCSIAIIILGLSTLQNRQHLINKGVETNAIITNIRYDTDSEVDHQVQYKFTTEDAEIQYSFSDETGRRNLWYAPTEGEWEDIQNHDRIRVAYLPENPWINRPLDNINTGYAFGLVLLGISIGAVWFWLFRENKKRSRRPPEGRKQYHITTVERM